MKKLFQTKTNEKFSVYMIALVFCLMSILVVNASMLGMVDTEYEGIRTLITYGLMCLHALYLCYEAIKYIVLNRGERVKIILICAIPVLSLMMAAYSMVVYRTSMITNTMQFLIFMNTGYVAGVITVEYNLIGKVITAVENLSIFYFPYACFYIHGLIQSGGNNGTTFYGLKYLTIGMYILIPITAMILNYVYYGQRKLYGFIPVVLSNCIRIVLVIAYIYLILMANGSRGPVLAFMVFIVALVITTIVRKIQVKKSTFVALVSFAVIAIFMVAPINNRLSVKVDIVIDNFLAGNGFVTSSRVDDVTIDFESEADIVDSEDSESEMDMADNEDSEASLDAQTESTDISTLVLADRGVLFTLAINESIQNPFGGLGVLGYTYKYGKYPHNAVLEILADFGIVFGGMMLLIILFVFIKLFLCTKHNRNIITILLFAITFATLAMSSGTVYENVVLYYGLGFGLCYIVSKKEKVIMEKD